VAVPYSVWAGGRQVGGGALAEASEEVMPGSDPVQHAPPRFAMAIITRPRGEGSGAGRASPAVEPSPVLKLVRTPNRREQESGYFSPKQMRSVLETPIGLSHWALPMGRIQDANGMECKNIDSTSMGQLA